MDEQNNQMPTEAPQSAPESAAPAAPEAPQVTSTPAPTTAPEAPQQDGNYGKSSGGFWKWLLIYVIIALVLYGIIWYFFLK